MTGDAETLGKLSNLMALITEARQEIAAGEMIDMADIQGRVQSVCEEIQANPPLEPAAVEAAINQMVENLNILATELTSQHKSLGDDVVRRAARSAYKTPEDDN